MESLEKKHQKRNLLYLLLLIKYFLKTGSKPPFEKDILDDISFLSLVKNIYLTGIAYLSLSDYEEFKETWLERELKNYYLYYKDQDEKNNEIKVEIQKYAKENNKEIIFIRDSAYKQLDNYIPGSRFSSDTDILIKKKDLFHLHTYLRNNDYLLQGFDFDLIYKPHLYIDRYFDVLPKLNKSYHKREIIDCLENNYRTFNYFKDSFLEVHVPVLNDNEIDKNDYFKYTDGNILQPEFDIITQANHFFLHLKYNETQENRLKTFLAFLERIVDVFFVLNRKLDWDKLLFLSAEYNISHQVFYYLNLANKYLNIDIPASVLNSLRKQSSVIDILRLKLLPETKILRDKHTFSVSIYSKYFLNIAQNINDINILHKSKEAQLILKILSKNDLYDEYTEHIETYDSELFLSIAKETATEGLLYYKLKNNSGIKKFDLLRLKQTYKAISSYDKVLKKGIENMNNIPVNKVFIKDCISVIENKYKTGTRYSCDVDILIDKDETYHFDREILNLGYITDNVEISYPEEMLQRAFAINKDVLKIQEHLDQKIFYSNKYKFEREDLTLPDINEDVLLFDKRIDEFEFKVQLIKKDYSDRISRINKIKYLTDKSINYRGNEGDYIDCHVKLFNDYWYFRNKTIEPEKVKISENNFKLCTEDKIIIDACHFVLNFAKYPKQYEFQGFIKYLLDFKLYESDFDTDTLLTKAKKYDVSAILYFYLKINKDYLDSNVSTVLIDDLKSQSLSMELFLMKMINRKKLLFNKKSIGLVLFSKYYLENGFVSSILRYSFLLAYKIFIRK